MIAEYYNIGVEIGQIITELGNVKSSIAEGARNKSRKDIIQGVVNDLLNTFKKRDNCDIIVTFFNESITAEGLGEVELFYM